MTKKQILNQIYPSVVTYGADWKKSIREVKKFRLKIISLFLTGAKTEERKVLYRLLAQSGVKQIPHVHLRHDCTEEEINYFINVYGTKVFTTHYEFIDKFAGSKNKKKIFVENNWIVYSHKKYPRIKEFGGLCIDLSHLKVIWFNKQGNLNSSKKALKRYRVGLNHISEWKANGTSNHHAKALRDVDYLAKIPRQFFSKYLNIEMTNSIKEQLEFKNYIADLLYKVWNKKS